MTLQKHAYFIAAFNNWDVLKKLVLLLDHEKNDIYIHINRSVQDFDFEYFQSLPKRSDLYFTERFDTEWGTPCLMVAQLYFFQKAHIKHYQYYHFLSGADLPLKTQEEIHAFFDAHAGQEFVHFVAPPPMPRRIYDRYAYDHRFHKYIRGKSQWKRIFLGFFCENIYVFFQKLFHIDKQKKNPHTLCFGGTWWSVTDDLVNYVLENWDLLLDLYKHTFAPDETYLATLVYNSSFREKLFYDKMDDNYIACMRNIDWKRGQPYTWHSKDYEELMNSGFLFARKFDPAADQEIIEKIYQAILLRQTAADSPAAD